MDIQDNDVEETLTSGVDVAASSNISPNSEDILIELGDLIEIVSEKHKKVKGRVYYRDLDMIKIMPDGVSNIVYEFPLIEEDGEGVFDPELGVQEITFFEKRRLTKFVEQHNLHAGFYIETFFRGVEGPSYKIINVFLEEDAVEIENEIIMRIDFNGIGIPRDIGFDVIRQRESLPDTEAEAEIVPEAAVVPEEVIDEEAEEILDIDEDGFEKVEVQLTGITEVAVIQEVEELAAIFRRHPEALQKSDLLTDLLTFLNEATQKDPNRVRNIRSLVEQYSILKQQLLRVNEQGQPIGIEPSSVYTMKELENLNVPLIRPVVKLHKKLFINKNDLENNNPEETFQYDADITKLIPAEEDMVNILKGPEATSNSVYYDALRTYLETYRPYDTRTGRPSYTAKADTEVLRVGIDDDSDAVKFSMPKKDEFIPYVAPTKGLAMERMLGATYRPSIDGPNKILVPAEKSKREASLIFPYTAAEIVGSAKTGSLKEDIMRSQVNVMTLNNVVDKFSDDDITNGLYKIEDRPIGFDDYLRKQPIIGYGPGDFHEALVDYGLREHEINTKQLAVFEEKMRSCISQVIEHLRKLREEMKDIPETSVKKFFETDIDKTIPESEPLLDKILDNLKKTSPTLYQTDIGRIAELLRENRDLYMAVIGNVPQIVAAERIKSVRRGYAEALLKSQKMKAKREDVAAPPEPNNCEHVKRLRAIRAIEDPQEQVLTMIRFLSLYQGERKDKQCMCIKCNKPLLCEHEILQLQQSIYPRKSEVLAKQLHLDFAGGSYGRYYICKVCGQPFSEIGYDTSIEFDDEGRPMMGRAVMEDKDAMRIEEIDSILEIKEDAVENFDYPTPLLNTIYMIAKKINGKIGINMDRDSMDWVVMSSQLALAKEPDQLTYMKIMEAQKKKGPAASQIDYEVYISRAIIAIVAANILIDVQTKVPNYRVEYVMPGCVPGFSGFPLESEENLTGINYVSCAIASIMDKEAPWNKTGFQRESSYTKRQAIIAKFILSNLKKFVTDSTIINKIAEKRDYLVKEHGIYEGRPRDEVPPLLRPTQIQIEAADITEAPTDATSAWILSAHKIARDSAILLKGSALAETNCCVHELSDPNKFWSEKELPLLDDRKMNPMTGVRIVMQDSPRPLPVILAEPPESIYHRLFLNVCYDGDNVGLPHEVGFDNVCTWCNFRFPGNPAMINPDKEGLDALRDQGIDIGPQSFQNLLDRVHRNYSVEAYTPPVITSMQEIFTRVSNLEPVPVNDWKEMMDTLAADIDKLGQSGQLTAIQISYALGTLSQKYMDLNAALKTRIGDIAVGTLEEIVNAGAEQFMEIMGTYFLTPFMRIYKNASDVQYTKGIKKSKISREHAQDIEGIIGKTIEYLNKYGVKLQNSVLSKAKLEYAVRQLSAFMRLKSVFRPILIVGGNQVTRYIQRVILFGVLNSLCNPSEIPPGADNTDMNMTIMDNSSKIMLELLQFMLARFRHERLGYSPEQIKLEIAMRAEKESKNMIQYFDKMSDEEKRIALTERNLGIGRFGAERAAAAWKYSSSRYDIEKVERMEMGAVDFKGFEFQAPEGGFGADAGGEGYDVAQMAADDY